MGNSVLCLWLFSVSLSPEEANQFLRRHRRANHVFEETKQGHLERECVEEKCSKEEAREVFENDPETLWTNIPDQCSPSPCNPRGTVRCEDQKGDFLYTHTPSLECHWALCELSVCLLSLSLLCLSLFVGRSIWTGCAGSEQVTCRAE
uniref:Gla domain-containing protein n=1 Tax=Oncorhynchus kisutch TaxID=8019 RepID=A0A8C7L9M7_ONCKI